jgi:arsenate reductase
MNGREIGSVEISVPKMKAVIMFVSRLNRKNPDDFLNISRLERSVKQEKPCVTTVLFLCMGNSCRSQIAEALMNHYLPDQWHAFSAGIAPAGYVHPMAIQVLEELGINHQGTSKWVEQFIGQKFDRVITLCGGAENNCPAWLGEGKKEHIGFVDPAQIPGKDEEKLAGFREVRDEMLVSIVDYLKKS